MTWNELKVFYVLFLQMFSKEKTTVSLSATIQEDAKSLYYYDKYFFSGQGKI